MKISKIIGLEGPKPELCNGGGCPTLLLTEDGDVLIQGDRLNPKEDSQVTAPDHESFVKMPLATLQQLVKHI